MPRTDWNLRTLQEELLQEFLLGLCLACIPSYLISISRIPVTGFRWFYIANLLLVLAVFFLWATKSAFSYTTRVLFLLTLMWAAILIPASKLGLLAESRVFVVTFSFTAILFLPLRWGIVLISLMSLSIVGLGFAATQRWLTFSIRSETYSYNLAPWLNHIATLVSFSALLAYIGWRVVVKRHLHTVRSQKLARRLSHITEQVPGEILQLTLSSGGGWSFDYINSPKQTLLGRTAKEFENKAQLFFESIHKDDRERVREGLHRATQNMTLWEDEFRIVDPLDGEQWYFGTSTSEQLNNEEIALYGYFLNITEKKMLINVKNEFLTTVSHELRTPLTSIKGSLQLLNSGLVQKEKAQHLLHIAEKNSKRLLLLINDLLDSEKYNSGDFSLQMKPTKVAPFLTSCVEENQAYAREHKVSIELGECSNTTIDIDVQRMKQVMANLLSNACKFSPEGEKVLVSAYLTEDNCLKIAVEDRGNGIPSKFHSKIFERFSQAEDYAKRTTKGTGLGLSIAKTIVGLHGGELTFESSPGVGTTFYVELRTHKAT